MSLFTAKCQRDIKGNDWLQRNTRPKTDDPISSNLRWFHGISEKIRLVDNKKRNAFFDILDMILIKSRLHNPWLFALIVFQPASLVWWRTEKSGWEQFKGIIISLHQLNLTTAIPSKFDKQRKQGELHWISNESLCLLLEQIFSAHLV